MNAPISQNLEIVQKTSKTYEICFLKDGVNLDITGWTIFFTAKEKMTDTDAEAVISKTITTHAEATSGKSLIELTPAETNVAPKTYVYDIKYKDDSTVAQIGVIIQGKLTVTRIVTQRES